MRVRWLIIALLCASILFYVSLRAQRTIAVGNTLADFALASVDGHILHLHDFRGQVVLLNFWATFCQACAAEMPSLNGLVTRFAGKPLAIIGVSEDGPPEIAWPRICAYQQQLPMQFPVVVDPHGSVADEYGTFMLPESYLIDRQGHLIRKIVGAIAWDHPTVTAELEKLLQPSK